MNDIRKVKIAIVDSGVRLDHHAIIGKQPQLIRYTGLENGEGNCGHGTAIFNIISKAEKFADIINFQITNKDEEISEDELIGCLCEIRDNYDVDIINLSLGLSFCDDITRLRNICDELSAKGIIIVSAFDNMGALSYPAVFENVIGVTSVDICRKIDDFIVFEDNVINIGANGNMQRLAWNKPDYIISDGNSFACAHTAVQIARFMSDGVRTFSEIIDKFKEIALQIISPPHPSMINSPLFQIERAVLFPFNKEMHSLIRFHNLLSFDISGVYDIRESSHVGSTTNHIMKDDVSSFVIQNIENIDWFSFDTIILGNFPTHNSERLSKIRTDIVNKAISFNKNIFSFDDLRRQYNYERLYCPTVDLNDLPPSRMGKLYRISKPVIGVYGTSSRQGKFTLQLKLRERFLENRYSIGQIGTEPSAQLFGIDYVYPMGYNNSVYIDGHDAISYINHCMNSLCQNHCDIILTGSQSSVLPCDVGNLAMFPMRQYSFLMGTQPDCIILCINPYDDYEYIERSISFLESCVDGKVISLCMFPMKYRNEQVGMYMKKDPLSRMEFENLKKSLQKNFLIPVYHLGDENDIDLLFNNIVDFFHE